MNTYPEMNEKIVALLRMMENPTCLYAAQRIEELEADMRLGEALRRLPVGATLDHSLSDTWTLILTCKTADGLHLPYRHLYGDTPDAALADALKEEVKS